MKAPMDNLKKSFIITIDTEEDNQWCYNHAQTTENAKYLPRFQELCEKYGFMPTYLTTYGMASDNFFADYVKKKSLAGACEVGMHMHAWHVPPEHNLAITHKERQYITEYPNDIIEEKIHNLTNHLSSVFEQKIISHRSGRWTTNDAYLKMLVKYGYKVDCSVTPFINWEKTVGATGVGGSDYSKSPICSYEIVDGLLELPMSIRRIRSSSHKITSLKSIIKSCYYSLFGRNVWIRPSDSPSSIEEMLRLSNSILNEKNTDYIMFMIHSSELMPGGSPNFKDSDSIERLYKTLEILFDFLSTRTNGETLKGYYERKYNNVPLH